MRSIAERWVACRLPRRTGTVPTSARLTPSADVWETAHTSVFLSRSWRPRRVLRSACVRRRPGRRGGERRRRAWPIHRRACGELSRRYVLACRHAVSDGVEALAEQPIWSVEVVGAGASFPGRWLRRLPRSSRWSRRYLRVDVPLLASDQLRQTLWSSTSMCFDIQQLRTRNGRSCTIPRRACPEPPRGPCKLGSSHRRHSEVTTRLGRRGMNMGAAHGRA